MIYLDTSVVLPLFVSDLHTGRVRAWLGDNADMLTMSYWTMAEFSSAAAGQVRMGKLTDGARVAAERAFDAWAAGAQQASVLRADFELARDLIRRNQLRLRTPDALHLAVVRRLGVALATLDDTLVDAARQIGVMVATL